MGLEPTTLAWEAVPKVTMFEDERLRSRTAMRVCGTRQSVDPHSYVLTFPGACGMWVARRAHFSRLSSREDEYRRSYG